jgi:hypothetical protein
MKILHFKKQYTSRWGGVEDDKTDWGPAVKLLTTLINTYKYITYNIIFTRYESMVDLLMRRNQQSKRYPALLMGSIISEKRKPCSNVFWLVSLCPF